MTKADIRRYKRIAKELQYDRVMPDIFDRLTKAKDDKAADRIMVDARHRL